MSDKKELKEEDLISVSGGSPEFGGTQEWGTQKVGYCKYCGQDKLLTYVGTDTGFVYGISVGKCNKWRCEDCKCDNYYRQLGGVLLQ